MIMSSQIGHRGLLHNFNFFLESKFSPPAPIVPVSVPSPLPHPFLSRPGSSIRSSRSYPALPPPPALSPAPVALAQSYPKSLPAILYLLISVFFDI